MRIEFATAGPQGPPFRAGDVVYLPGIPCDLYLVGLGYRPGETVATTVWTSLATGMACGPGASDRWRKVPSGTRVVLEL